MKHLAVGALVALLVFAMAVTPLETLLRPGHFEWANPSTYAGGPRTTATLDDDTGLVSAFYNKSGDRRPVSSSRELIAPWEGDSCGDEIAMRFTRADDGHYRLVMHTRSRWCLSGAFGIDFALALRAPVDPATVEVVND